MNNLAVNSASVSERAIAVEAYYLWEASGRPEGRAMEHWLDAEARLARALSEAREAARKARRLRYGLVLRR